MSCPIPLHMRPRILSLFVLVVGQLICTGCHQGVYRPDNLPGSFNVRTRHAARSTNLSRVDASATAVNTIYSGDVLRISIDTGAEVRTQPEYRTRVNENGEVQLPEIGTIVVAGMDVVHAEKAISGAAVERRIYYHPVVTVNIDDRRTYQVTVDGAVEKPGNYQLTSNNCDVMAALLAAGGLTDEAGSIVEIRSRVEPANSGQILQTGFNRTSSPPDDEPATVAVRHIDLSAPETEQVHSCMLQDGAIVTVEKGPERVVNVVGLVKRSGKVDFPDDAEFRMLDAITMSGGIKTEFADKVKVIRRNPETQQHTVVQSSIHRAKENAEWNLRLLPGDIVSVEDTVASFTWRSTKEVLGTALTAVRIMTGI